MVSVCMAAYVVGVYVILTWFKDPVSICRFLLAYLQTAIDVKIAKRLHSAPMTAAPLSWHHARAHISPFISSCNISWRHCNSTDTEALLPDWHGGSGDQINCHLRLKRSALQRGDCGRFLPNDSGTPKCQRDSMVLFMFATKMATESAVGRNSLVDFCCLCRQRGVWSNSDARWRYALTARRVAPW